MQARRPFPQTVRLNDAPMWNGFKEAAGERLAAWKDFYPEKTARRLERLMRVQLITQKDDRKVEREHQAIVKIRIIDPDGRMTNAVQRKAGMTGGVSLRDPYTGRGGIHAQPGEIHKVREEDARMLVGDCVAEYLSPKDQAKHDATEQPAPHHKAA